MLRERRIKITVVAIIIIAAIVIYMFANPATGRYFPKCIILSITGYKCPGCGSQRFIHAILNGDIAQAAHYNAFLLGAVPMIILYLINDYTKWLPKWVDNVLKHPATIAILIVAMLAWWVLRNVYNW